MYCLLFMGISDAELNKVMNPECKMEYDKYRNLKFNIFDNKFLDTFILVRNAD